MPSARVNEPLLNLASYARRGPGRRDHLSRGEIAQISRTVRRVPEVMVKVLSRGGQDLKAVGRHIEYLRDREDGEREIETDDGRQLSGESVTNVLLNDWDLELEAHRNRSDLGTRGGGSQKLVHKLLFSMPTGTPPDKVLTAVKNLAREEFALKHRYAVVLHTDEPHPHVHMLLKTVSEQGARLHIRKLTLRHWRQEFARHLREQGVAANATERAVRGETRAPKIDGIYRASSRSDSTHTRVRAESVAAELLTGKLRYEAGKATLIETRHAIERGWRATSDILEAQGQPELASAVRLFIAQMHPACTEREQISQALMHRERDSRHLRHMVTK